MFADKSMFRRLYYIKWTVKPFIEKLVLVYKIVPKLPVHFKVVEFKHGADVIASDTVGTYDIENQ